MGILLPVVGGVEEIRSVKAMIADIMTSFPPRGNLLIRMYRWER